MLYIKKLDIKKVGIASLLALPLAFGSMTASADNDYIEQQIQQDTNYQSIKQQAISLLQKRGYQVYGVDADDHQGKPSLSIKANKGGREYDIVLSYPDLKILEEKLED